MSFKRCYRPPCSRPVATEWEKRRLNELFTHKGGKALPDELLHPIGPTPTELAQERKRKADLLKKRIEVSSVSHQDMLLRKKERLIFVP